MVEQAKLPVRERDFYAPLHVVSAISNPHRYRKRPELYREFATHVRDSGARLLTVETAYGERPHEVTEAGNPAHVQLRTDSEVWNKEAMLNIGISRLPADWKYVAWIDADVTFVRPDWVRETIEQLQHFAIVQLWSEALDLSPAYEPFQRHRSFAACRWRGAPRDRADGKPQGYSYARGIYWHPGFAWACRRATLDALGGLIDWNPLGANDHHMALALMGEVQSSFHGGCHPEFKRSMSAWQDRAMTHVRGNLGHVDGLIVHHFHGRKRDRNYRDRWNVLVDHQFVPGRDLKRDWQGLWRLTDRSPGLRDDIRRYLKSRNEDSIDLDESERTI